LSRTNVPPLDEEESGEELSANSPCLKNHNQDDVDGSPIHVVNLAATLDELQEIDKKENNNINQNLMPRTQKPECRSFGTKKTASHNSNSPTTTNKPTNNPLSQDKQVKKTKTKPSKSNGKQQQQQNDAQAKECNTGNKQREEHAAINNDAAPNRDTPIPAYVLAKLKISKI